MQRIDVRPSAFYGGQMSSESGRILDIVDRVICKKADLSYNSVVIAFLA